MTQAKTNKRKLDHHFPSTIGTLSISNGWTTTRATTSKEKLKKFTKHCNSVGNLCGSEEMNRKTVWFCEIAVP